MLQKAGVSAEEPSEWPVTTLTDHRVSPIDYGQSSTALTGEKLFSARFSEQFAERFALAALSNRSRTEETISCISLIFSDKN